MTWPLPLLITIGSQTFAWYLFAIIDRPKTRREEFAS
jgi:hypothetical protein